MCSLFHYSTWKEANYGQEQWKRTFFLFHVIHIINFSQNHFPKEDFNSSEIFTLPDHVDEVLVDGGVFGSQKMVERFEEKLHVGSRGQLTSKGLYKV